MLTDQIIKHEYYCITCLFKLVALLFCFSIGIIVLYLTIFNNKNRTSIQRKGSSHQQEIAIKREITLSVLILSLFAVIFYCISLTAALIGDIFIDSIYWFGAPYSITSITWAIANIFLYLTFMKRMRNIFINTSYSSPNSTYIKLSVIIFIYFNCEVTFFVLEIYSVIKPNEIDDELKFKIETIVAIIEVFADVTISLVLTYLFSKKLMNVALYTFDRNELIESHQESLFTRQSFSDDIKVTSTQYQLLNISVKQTILAVIGTFTTQIWLLYYVPLAVIWSFDHGISTDKLYILHVISECILVTDCCINSLCVLLAFVFVKQSYHKLCGCCHQCCLRISVNITKRRVAQELSDCHELDSYHRLREEL